MAAWNRAGKSYKEEEYRLQRFGQAAKKDKFHDREAC
jgi:hypothetical protein